MDGSRQSTEAPGAGAANVVVADNTPPANAASGNPSPANATGQGDAGSPGGPLPPLSTQPGHRTHGAQAAHLRAVVAPLQTARIATALIQLNEAQNKLVAAKRSGDAPTIAAAERGVQVAKHNLAKAIKQEAERLSPPFLVRGLRGALSRYITHKFSGGQNIIPAYLISKEIEDAVRGAVETSGASYLGAIAGSASAVDRGDEKRDRRCRSP